MGISNISIETEYTVFTLSGTPSSNHVNFTGSSAAGIFAWFEECKFLFSLLQEGNFALFVKTNVLKNVSIISSVLPYLSFYIT